MVFRTEAIHRRLARLEEVVATLQRLDYDQTSTEDSWAVERGLQLAAECIFDIGNHILSAHFGHSVEGYELILQALAERKVIDGQLRSELAGLGGFRKTLVHAHQDVDPERVQEAQQKLPTRFSRYRIQVENWTNNQKPKVKSS